MTVELSQQASMVNAHVAARLMDDPNFKHHIKKLLHQQEDSAQIELSAYIRSQFNGIADVERVSNELISAWSQNSTEPEVKVKQLVRKNRSTLVFGLLLFSAGVFGVSLMVSATLDHFIGHIILGIM